MTNSSQSLKEISVGDILGIDKNGEELHGTRAFVLDIVRNNPEGITSNMVAQAVGISSQRAWTILNDLCARREIYSRDVGLKNHLYYPNGKLIHKYLQETRDIESQIFRISVHEGRRSARLQIQERRYTLLDGEKMEGSIFVDMDKVEDLIHFLEEMVVRYHQFDEKMCTR